MNQSGLSLILESFGDGAGVAVGRELAAAVVAAALFAVTAPRGRRWLAWAPLVLILLSPLPLAVAPLFPDAADAPRMAMFGVRFFLLASLLQSVLLLVAVSLWERVAQPMPRIFLDVLRIVTVLAALLTILFEVGVKADSLFTGSAVLTAVLGFALKDTLGNVFAGLAIHAERPFELDDWIQYDTNPAHIGRVMEINWRATKVLTLDEAYVIIPNGQLAQASIRNFTKPDPWSRRSLYVIAPYEVSPQQVQQIILDAIRGSFGVLEHPAPSVVTNDFRERGIEYWVRLFTTEFGKRDRVDGMARDRIWYALARHGIEIPVATQDIRLTQLPTPLAEQPGAALDRRAASLRQIGLFTALGPDDVRRLAEECEEQVYAAGEPVIRQGDVGDSMFVVTDGRVEVTAEQSGVEPVRLAVLNAGDYFGEMSLMTGAARVATVTPLVETRLLEVGKEAFRHVLATHPELVAALGAALRQRQANRAEAIAETGRPATDAPDILQKIRSFFSM
jgi:small-conductance mechanosensitive channel/CRP-like cAMP-binding protein